MVNYSNGKVYKIWSPNGDKIYIGSTTKQYLSQRMDNHRYQYKQFNNCKMNNVMSFILFNEYGLENCKIELLEAKECNNKDELLKLEGKYIRELECVNKYIAGRTKKEWGEDNKDTLKDKRKIYKETNKEILKEKDKKYRELNKEKIKEKKKEKIICICGSKICFDLNSRHLKTKKHQNFIK
jgi:hypothetical protein